MKLFLAPMEGVTDWVMRDLLTEVGGVDQCVTEFLRVTDKLYPDSVFFKNCPELRTQSRTRSGTPVFVQLLGGQAEPLAENAYRAYELGALGIDLNFGCPAKTVNRHDGGATLLKYTDRVYKIVSTVRKAVPLETPVTAKIRLGFDEPSACLENAKAVEEAGANWLTVHCRTKTNGYQPPAFWEWIPRIQEVSKIPLVTNGEIWNLEDFKKCRHTAKTDSYMIGRGALRNPFLFREIHAWLESKSNSPSSHNSQNAVMQPQSVQDQTHLPHSKPFQSREIASLLPIFFDNSTEYSSSHFAVARTKQWLKQLSLADQSFQAHFEELKLITDPELFKAKIRAAF